MDGPCTPLGPATTDLGEPPAAVDRREREVLGAQRAVIAREAELGGMDEGVQAFKAREAMLRGFEGALNERESLLVR